MFSYGLILILLEICTARTARRKSAATILDCSRRNANGLYARGCSSKFMRCYNGKQYDYTCPKQLKFNVETAKCEERRQIIACINNMDDSQVIVKADEPFDCSKKKDGVYGSGKCSTTYYHCSRGHSSEMICPAGLYYNDKLKGCDDADSIDECDVLNALRGYDERRESHLGEKGKYIERNLRSGTGGMVIGGFVGGTRSMSLSKAKGSSSSNKGRKAGKKRRTRQALFQASLWKPERVFNCSGISDGNYALVHGQCSKHFWRCTGGKTSGRTCRNELYFNSAIAKCDLASNIADCKDIDEEDEVIEKAKEPVGPDCSVLDDGPFEHSICSPFYYRCTAGQLLKLECPGNQVYDIARKRCDMPESVSDCTSESSSTSSRIISAPNLSSTFPNSSKFKLKNVGNCMGSYCARSGDGIHSAGCKNYFYFCASGYGHRVNCPNGLFFDSGARACDHRQHVSECNPENLEERAAGAYEKDSSADRSDQEEEKIVTHVRASHIPEAAMPALMSIPLPRAKDLPFLPDDFDCSNKADGLYSIGCKTEYVVCVNSRMFFFQCPDNLIFDELMRSCDYAENIPECLESVNFLARTADIDEKEPPLTRPSGTPRRITTEEGHRRVQARSIHMPGYCEKLNDGIYFDNSCEKDYVICSKKFAFFHSCPEGQIMDPISKTCNDPGNIPGCAKN